MSWYLYLRHLKIIIRLYSLQVRLPKLRILRRNFLETSVVLPPLTSQSFHE